MKTFKQFIAEDDLNDLALVMAIRKELDLDREDAEETLAWLRDERGADLPDDAYNAMDELFSDKLQTANVTSSQDSEEFLQQWMYQHLKKKYKLDTGWPV